MLLKHLTKFIERYVICKHCKYPELQRFSEGKNDLRSKCMACGQTTIHDAHHKAGKSLLLHLGKKTKEDITNKDGKNADVQSDESGDQSGNQEGEE